MRRNLVDRSQMGIPLRRRDVAVAHDFLPDRLRFAELSKERGGRMAQRMERGAVDRPAEGEPGSFDGQAQAGPDGRHGTLPVLDHVSVRALPRIAEDDPELLADRYHLGAVQRLDGLVPMDGDETKVRVDHSA